MLIVDASLYIYVKKHFLFTNLPYFMELNMLTVCDLPNILFTFHNTHWVIMEVNMQSISALP